MKPFNSPKRTRRSRNVANNEEVQSQETMSATAVY